MCTISIVHIYQHYSNEDFEALDSARPKVETLYDVFSCIRDDEGEHVKTMAAMQGESCRDDDSCDVLGTDDTLAKW
jgi:hypothetical protein